MNYFIRVILRLLAIILLPISFVTGIAIVPIIFIISFILELKIPNEDEIAFNIMFWPIYILDKIEESNIYRKK